MNGLMGPTFKIRRNFVYEFPEKEGCPKSECTVFSDEGYGLVNMDSDGIKMVAPVMFSGNGRRRPFAKECITIDKIDDPFETEISIKWYQQGNVFRELFFKAGEKITSAIPMQLKEPMSKDEAPNISAYYQVNDVTIEFTERGFYACVSFDSLLDVLLEDGSIENQLFSTSYYEIDAEQA